MKDKFGLRTNILFTTEAQALIGLAVSTHSLKDLGLTLQANAIRINPRDVDAQNIKSVLTGILEKYATR